MGESEDFKMLASLTAAFAASYSEGSCWLPVLPAVPMFLSTPAFPKRSNNFSY
jgi:hypothetical protein